MRPELLSVVWTRGFAVCCYAPSWSHSRGLFALPMLLLQTYSREHNFQGKRQQMLARKARVCDLVTPLAKPELQRPVRPCPRPPPLRRRLPQPLCSVLPRLPIATKASCEA